MTKIKIDKYIYDELKHISTLKSCKERLIEFLKDLKPFKQRSNLQNRSIHKLLALVSEELQQQGHTMQDVVRAIRKAEIPATPNALKEVVWKPLQEVMLGKKSTTELETYEVDQVYEVFNHWLGREFHIHVPFPSEQHDQT